MAQEKNDETRDMLDSIFTMQSELNDFVFKKNMLRDENGNQLCTQTIVDQANWKNYKVNDLPNQWLSRFAKAMDKESDELKAELLWKWWSKDEIDMQNIRVELVDILHFLVSAMICTGLTSDKLYDVYKQKYAINIARQNSGYSQATKNEDDNKTIK